jgi:hypothetical protein
MRNPQRGQPATADWGIEVVAEVNRNRPIAGLGIRATVGPNGTVLSLEQRDTPPRPADGTGYPRPFGISFEGGMIRVSDPVCQIGDELVILSSQGDTVQVPANGGYLYAMINASNKRVTYITVAGASGKPDTMDGLLFPVVLYRFNAGGAVALDLRGCAIVMAK